MPEGLIPVLPKNYRRIALFPIEASVRPAVLMDRHQIDDFSESGRASRKRGFVLAVVFEVRDGSTPILGFHDHPNQMWVAAGYRSLAEHCAAEGWLRIQGPAS